MTLAERFPDVSMLIRKRNKLNLKYNAAFLFKDIRYMAISPYQIFYNKEIRIFHVELISFIVVLLGTLGFIFLNAHSLLK
ncbi:MAG TPA: hypothetical protein VIU13_11280 [Chryseolinea sp.]